MSDMTTPASEAEPGLADGPSETGAANEAVMDAIGPEANPADNAEGGELQDELGFVPASELPGGIAAALEAVLLVGDSPLSPTELSIVLGVPADQVQAALIELAADYRGAHGGPVRGFELREVGGGWRLYTAPAYADIIARYVREGQSAKLTQAALETLAIVAYRQPISRGRISAVRGVNVDSVVRTLVARGLIGECGQDAESGALLYGTTTEFLERMGMNSLDELVPLAPYLPEDAALAEIAAEVTR